MAPAHPWNVKCTVVLPPLKGEKFVSVNARPPAPYAVVGTVDRGRMADRSLSTTASGSSTSMVSFRIKIET